MTEKEKEINSREICEVGSEIQDISSGLACDENFRVVDGKHTEEFIEFYVFCLL